MGVKYSAVGGYGYKWESEVLKKCLTEHVEKNIGISDIEKMKGLDLGGLCSEEIIDEKIIDFPDGFVIYDAGDCYEGNLITMITSEEHDIKRDFTPLKSFLTKYGIPFEGEPKIIIELHVW